MNRNSIEKLTKYAKKINTKIEELRREISKNPIIIPIEKPYLSGWKLTLKLDTYNLNPKLIKDYETVLDLFKNRRENEHFTRNPLLIRHIRKNNYDWKSLYNYSGKTKNREDYFIRNSFYSSKSWRFRISKETYNNLTPRVQIYFNLIDDSKSKYTGYYLNYTFLDKHFKIKIEKYYKTEIKLSNPTLVSEKTQLDNKFRHLQLDKYLYCSRYRTSYQTTIKRRSTLNDKLYKDYYNVNKELTDDDLLEIDNKSKINNYKKFGWS